MGQDNNRKGPVGKRPPAKPGEDERDMGSALRSVYEKTVQEQIPDDLLDLLGKLN